MAKRKINTKFVIGLGAVMGAAALTVAGVYGWNWYKDKDPEGWLTKARAAEAENRRFDAIYFYQEAARRGERTGMSGLADIYYHIGELCILESEKNPKLYGVAIANFGNAVRIAPSMKKAQERLLENRREVAMFDGRAEAWTSLKSQATSYLEQDKENANVYVIRAQATFATLRGVSDPNIVRDRMAEIEADLNDALRLSPTNAEATSLKGRVMLARAAELTNEGRTEAGKKLKAEAFDLIKNFTDKQPDEPFTSLLMAQLFLERNDKESAEKILASAWEKNQTDPGLTDLYVRLVAVKSPDTAEKVLKKLIELQPDRLRHYNSLAFYYENSRRLEDAIAMYKEITTRPKLGTGIRQIENNQLEMNALFMVSKLNMDLAQRADINTDAGKKFLVEGASYADKLRNAHPTSALLFLLDGRMQLLRNQIPQAVSLLRKADQYFTTQGTAGSVRWVDTKLLLAEAYQYQNDPGSALKLYDEISKALPSRGDVALRRADILNRIGRPTEALKIADAFLAQDPTNQFALRIKAGALFGLSRPDEAQQILQSIDNAGAMLQSARIKYLGGELEPALETLNRILEKDDKNDGAMNLAALCLMQLDRRDEAKSMVERGLKVNPQNTQLQVIKHALAMPKGDAVEMQRQAIESIQDDYIRSMALAQFYAQLANREKELEFLVAADTALSATPDRARQYQGEVVDRVFTVAISLALSSKNDASKKLGFDTAQRYWQKAERLNLDGVNGKLYEGRLDFAKGNKRNGLRILEEAVAMRPDYSPGRTILGQAYFELEMYDQALEELNKAIEMRPNNVVALKGAIALHLRQNDPGSLAQAKELYRAARTFAPGDRQLLAFADELEDDVEVIRVRENIRQRDPDNLENLRSLARLYVRAKQLPKAVETLELLYQKRPDDIEVADALGRLYREVNRINDALAIYQKFLGSSDKSIQYSALLRLARLYRSLNQPNEAIQTYKEALARQPADSSEAQRQLGDLYFDIDDLKNAEEMYRKVYDGERGNDMKVLRRLVETLIRQEKFAEAQKLLQDKVLRDRPDDAEGLVLQGFALLRQRKADEAVASFNRVLDKNPDNIDALHYRAFAQFFMQADLDKAVSDLLRVRSLNANAINSRLLLARVFRLNRQYAEAAREYRAVVALRPDLVPARVEFADYLFSLCEILQRLPSGSTDPYAASVRAARPYDALQDLLADSSARFRNQPVWAVMQGNLIALRGGAQSQQDSLQAFEAAFKSTNESPLAGSAYLGALYKAGKDDTVIELATRLIASRPQYGDYYIKRGQSYARSGKTTEALADFDQAMTLASRDLQLFLSVVRQAYAALPSETAINHLKKRYEANPKDLAVVMGLAQSLLTANRTKECAELMDKTLQNKDANSIRSLVLRIGALAYYQAADYNASVQRYTELLKLIPDDLEALNNMAFLLGEDMKKPAEALPYAERAIKVLRTKPTDLSFVNNGNVLDTYGWILFLNGQPDRALAELSRALQIEPMPITHLHIAKVHQSQKRLADAKTSATRALDLATKNNDAAIKARAEQFLKELEGGGAAKNP